MSFLDPKPLTPAALDSAAAALAGNPASALAGELSATFVAPLGGQPGEPAPAFKGDPNETDAVDSTKRITLESYQRPEMGPWGESLRFLNKKPQAKTMIAWYTPTNPALPWNATTNPMNSKADAWIGAHYAGQTDGTGIHGHISIETPMANGDLFSRFGIDFIDQTTKARGVDTTHSYFANTHLTHRQGDGAVFSISSGPGSAERRIEFSAASYVAGESPGYRDDTKRRWWLVTDQSSESGANAGSNFLIRNFTDDGTAIGTAFWMSRKTGNATFGEGVDQSARVGARWAGSANHGFISAPSAALNSGFAHYAAKPTTAADRVFNVSVAGDANARFVFDSNGKHEWGNGTAVRDVTLERKSANVLGTGSGNAFRTGLSATGSRPSASSVGQGSQFYDTTLNKPIWSTGSAWVDATGATV